MNKYLYNPSKQTVVEGGLRQALYLSTPLHLSARKGSRQRPTLPWPVPQAELRMKPFLL